jgi:outer membrane receptor protein involved in Fe transport
VRQTLALVVAFATAATAQEEAARPRAIEEIIVTAQKKEESVQEVPISITVVSGDFLRETGIDDMHELVEFTPNVRFTTIGTVFIRGIGNPFGSSAFDPSVGLALDELSINNPFYMADPLYDLEQFEVLRGPQGILFGKNTPAGLFNVRTAKPTKEFTGHLIGRGGDLGVHRLEAAFGAGLGPLADVAQFRFAFVDSAQEEDVHNTRLDSEEPDQRQRAARLQLAFQPLDDLDVLLIGSRAKTRTRYLRSQQHDLPQSSVDFQRTYDPEFEDDGFDHQNSVDLDLDQTRDTDLVQSNVHYRLGDVWGVRDSELVAVLGDTSLDDNSPYDGDLGPADVISLPTSAIGTHQRSVELRASGMVDAPFGWGEIEILVGGLLFESDLDSDVLTLAGENFDDYLLTPAAFEALLGVAPPGGIGFPSLNAAAAALGLAPIPGPDALVGDGIRFLLDQKTRSKAVFGRAAWHLTERWTLSLGARLTHETKDAHLRNECPGLGLLCAGLGVEAFDFDTDRSETDLSPRVTLEWMPLEDLNLFVTRSEGFKSGGFNNLSFTAATAEVEEESTVSWELGAKGALFDRTLTYGVTLFSTDVDDLQVQLIRGTFLLVQNAASARTRGVELDLQWLTPWEPLSLIGSAAFTDARFESYPDAPAPQSSGASSQDLSDRPLPNSPKVQFNLSPTLRFPLTLAARDLVATTALDVLYRGSSYLSEDLDPRHRRDDYATFGARVALATADGVWTLSVAGKNLSDEDTAELMGGNPLFPGGSLVVQEFQRSFFAELRLAW